MLKIMDCPKVYFHLRTTNVHVYEKRGDLWENN